MSRLSRSGLTTLGWFFQNVSKSPVNGRSLFLISQQIIETPSIMAAISRPNPPADPGTPGSKAGMANCCSSAPSTSKDREELC